MPRIKMNSNNASMELRAGELRLALRPDLGGCVAGLWLGSAPVLRSTEPGALESSRLSGCFPLVPYSNRLAHRRFTWQGSDYTTAPNFDNNPHSVHGTAWQQPWHATLTSESRVELHVAHRGNDHWPFAFEATQRFDLTPAGLRISMTVTNTDKAAQPVGLGWHPYFQKRLRSRLHLECSGRWESDPETQLPTRHVTQHSIDSDVKYLESDHCYDGWRGMARVRDEVMSVGITSSLSRAVVFTPATRDYFCVEPVSHASDAIHMADPLANGLVELSSGDTTQAWMQLDIAHA